MPSETPKQARFMAAAAHNPKFAKRVGIKPKVAKEFNRADTGTKLLSKAMKRQRYQGGGLAQAGMRVRRPQQGRGMIPPLGGGLQQAVKPQIDPRSRMMGTTPPQRTMVPPNMRPPGATTGPVGPQQIPPGVRPGTGALGQYAGAGGRSGAFRRPQQLADGQNRFMGRRPMGGAPNGLLRTAQSVSPNYGDRLQGMNRRLQFAKGGKVKRAIAALQRARVDLQDSDPSFELIASALGKDVPNAGGIAAAIRATAKKKPKTGAPDEFRADWQSINKKLDALEEAISKAGD